MCGITGGISQRDISPILLEGLKRLEYRGYDSAGVCIAHEGELIRQRVTGKVGVLEKALTESPIKGHLGIAHTRWATHGQVTRENAHPHMSSGRVAIVHNGIIENYKELKERLVRDGVQFESETDTEVIAHMVAQHLEQTNDLAKSVREVCKELSGAYALCVIAKDDPELLVATRHGSPLVVGLGIGENFVASDILALLPVTQKFMILEEGDVACVRLDTIDITDNHGAEVDRAVKEVQVQLEHSEKGAYRHFMQKEIFEQPSSVVNTLSGRLEAGVLAQDLFGPQADDWLSEVQQVHIVACGTSFHAGLVAAQWFEGMLGVPTRVEIASEMRYQRQVASPNTLFVTLSQSGETADTLAALRSIDTNKNYLKKLTICNVPESSLVRESDAVLLTQAGPEIGVCSTKAFVTQLVALFLLCAKTAKAKGIENPQLEEALTVLPQLPALIEQTLKADEAIEQVAQTLVEKQHILFLGRGDLYPIAKEGALKLKEISYIHAESYPAGELKHGPLALVDNQMPVVALASNNSLIDKLKSNLEEVQARHGQLIVFSTADAHMKSEFEHCIEIPTICPQLAPILLTIPMQMLAYHVACCKGTDVDQPRNLAKSVTVE